MRIEREGWDMMNGRKRGESDPRMGFMLQKVGAEMVGTFALVFAGCGAIMIDATSGVPIAGAIAGAWTYQVVRCGGPARDATGCC